MSMWPRNKPLSQPPGYRVGQDATPPVDQVAKEALQALRHARNVQQALDRNGRRTVSLEMGAH